MNGNAIRASIRGRIATGENATSTTTNGVGAGTITAETIPGITDLRARNIGVIVNSTSFTHSPSPILYMTFAQ